MLNLVTNPKDFRERVENLVNMYGMTYMEAVVHCCQTMGIEVDTAAKLLDKTAKEIIRAEATKLNMLRK